MSGPGPEVPETFLPAEELDTYLGDPLEPGHALSFSEAVARDESEAYPAAALEKLDAWGLCEFYVPVDLGGAFERAETAHALLRIVARRDVTVAVAHAKTFLGAAPVWVAGAFEQRNRVAALVRGRKRISLALTEELHGSDLIATDVSAERSGNGWRLRGEKWAISNATRGRALSVLARTGSGPRGLSVFFVDKDTTPSSTYSCLRKLNTHGVRGADISGIRFDGTPIAADGVVGGEGNGLEVVLKALQISRALVGALSLGAGDTALRATLAFARTRRLYGETLVAIPFVRHALVGAFVDLLVADCVSLGACRLLHTHPESMSSVSAVAKYFVPTTVEAVLRDLAVVLGARYYLREGHWSGVFEKVIRDAALISLFDGSTVVTLSALGVQLRLWTRQRAKAPDADRGLFDLSRPVPMFAPSRLELVHRGPHIAIEALGEWAESAVCDAPLDKDVRAALVEIVRALAGETDQLAIDVEHATERPGPSFARSPELFALARRYCALHAAGSCILAWCGNRAAALPFVASGEWLVVGLARLLASMRPRHAPAASQSIEARVWAQLLELDADGRLFSAVPVRLAAAGALQSR